MREFITQEYIYTVLFMEYVYIEVDGLGTPKRQRFRMFLTKCSAVVAVVAERYEW